MTETARKTLTAPALDPVGVEVRRGTKFYPPDLAHHVTGRIKQALGDAVGIKNFGVNLSRIEPGSWSALRHWHSREDEFIYMLEGELVLITDAGEQLLTPGMAAGFPAGVPDGHHLVNRSGKTATYLEVGDRREDDDTFYSDADLEYRHERGIFTRKNGTPV